MTKPNSRHLTTGTFNYVVKDPDCITHWAGSLDQGLTRTFAGCVPELDGAVCIAWLLADSYYRPSSLALSTGHDHCSGRTFEGHSAASGVLRELFEVIEYPASCQANRESFFCCISRFHLIPNQPSKIRAGPPANPSPAPSADPSSTQRKMSNHRYARRADTEL